MNLSTATKRNTVKRAEICIFAAPLRMNRSSVAWVINSNSFRLQPRFASGAKLTLKFGLILFSIIVSLALREVKPDGTRLFLYLVS